MALCWTDVQDSDRFQYINFVSYESDCIEKLKDLHIPFAWIKHDRDFNPDGGEIKKTHYHVLMDYGNTTTIKRWKLLLKGIPANDYAEITASPRGYFRYLIHADDPSKFQYPSSERFCECGFSEALLLSNTDTKFLIRKINAIIREENLTEYDDLLDFLDGAGLVTEFCIACSNTIHFENYLKGKRIKKSTKFKRENAKNNGMLPDAAGIAKKLDEGSK